MRQEDIQGIENLINSRLSKANQFLEESKNFSKATAERTLLESEIPGFEKKPMKFGQFEEREFVVMMTDIRKSTDIINSDGGHEKMFKIFYAYSAVIANIVARYNGTSTEFLGDGVLNLFEIDGDRKAALINAYQASREILYITIVVMNPIFYKNGLPEIHIGLGIDFGDTIVTRFGYKEDNDLKAFGKCVYNASVLSKGDNIIAVSEDAQRNWLVSDTGTLKFEAVNFRGKSGFRVYN